MDQSASNPSQTRARPTRNVFDEEGYLQLYPDIAHGVATGAVESGWVHFSQHGFAEGRQWVAREDPLAGVRLEISPGDEMFSGNAEHYFDVGESALRCIETALAAARRNPAAVRRILDLPCGHGRVLRFLRRAFPAAELTACDLNEGGVAYCAETFGAVPVVSQAEVDRIPLPGGYDLIWCGSLLTHLPAEKCAAFLRLFQRLLCPGGILVVTLHGRDCARELAAGGNRHSLTAPQIAGLLRDYNSTGFGYVDYLEQPAYGFSMAHPSFVTANLVTDPGWRLLGYHESGWDKRQDVLSLQKRYGLEVRS